MAILLNLVKYLLSMTEYALIRRVVQAAMGISIRRFALILSNASPGMSSFCKF